MVRYPTVIKGRLITASPQGPAWHRLLLLLYFHSPLLCLIFGHLSPTLCPPGWSLPSLLCYIALIWASGLWITSGITDWKASHSISLRLYWHFSSPCHSIAPPHSPTRPHLSPSHTYIYIRKRSGISCFSFSLVSPDLTYHLLLLLPPYQPASFRPRPLLSQLLLLCLSTLYLSLLQSPRLFPASLSFNSFSDILPARCLFLSPPPSTIIIGTMMLNQSHGYPGWQIWQRRKQIYHPLKVSALAKQACAHETQNV